MPENSQDTCGIADKYTVNPIPETLDEVQPFIRYLNCADLQIDIWDGDSKLLLGTAGVSLKSALRCGQQCVQSHLAAEVNTLVNYCRDNILTVLYND